MREKRGEYMGGTVQMIPHVTNELKLFMDSEILIKSNELNSNNDLRKSQENI